MEIRYWLMTTLILIVLPAWIGIIWVNALKPEGVIRSFLISWVSGFITMMAVAQVILVPMVLRRFNFSDFMLVAGIVYGLLALISLAVLLKRGTFVDYSGEEFIIEEDSMYGVPDDDKPQGKWWILFFCGALVLIFLQAIGTGLFQHIDDDDSRFIVEQVIAVDGDSMYKENVVGGRLEYWNVGDMKKDMISPWAMFMALGSKVSGIAPAIFSHKFFPIYMVLMCYAVYALLGMKLFPNSREKLSIFLIFVCALNIYGYFSTHTTQAVFLLRIWQGKAIVAALMIPLMTYLMWCLMAGKTKMANIPLYFLTWVGSAASSLASGTGITIVPIMIAAFGLAELIHKRSISRAILMWCTAIPSLIYLLCYINFFSLLKWYY
jgi:hypothetical protein